MAAIAAAISWVALAFASGAFLMWLFSKVREVSNEPPCDDPYLNGLFRDIEAATRKTGGGAASDDGSVTSDVRTHRERGINR